jgi:hypothetical protein
VFASGPSVAKGRATLLAVKFIAIEQFWRLACQRFRRKN